VAPIEVVAIVTSPLQVQNAIQYLRQMDIAPMSAAIVHVESTSEENNALSRDAIMKLDWGQQFAIAPFRSVPAPWRATPSQRRWWSRQRPQRSAPTDEERQAWLTAEIANRQSYVDQVRSIAESLAVEPVTRLLLGDYRPISFRQFLRYFDLQEVECVILDDGSVSRYVMTFRLNGEHADEILGHLPRHLGSEDPFEIIEPPSVTFFSIYDLPVAAFDRIEPNAKYSPLADRRLTDEIWVAGANHVEAGIAVRREYLKLCRRVAKWFPGRRVVYFPHRNESEAKLAAIVRATGFEVRRSGGGIEDYVIGQNVEPQLLLAFGSTVVDTLSRLFAPNWRVIVVVPGKKYFTSSRRVEHVRRIIRDNIRQNPRVLGVLGDGRGMRGWFDGQLSIKGLRVSTERIASPEWSSGEASVARVGRMQGLSHETLDEGWVRFRESPELGLHRIWLGTFQDHGSAFVHKFRFRSEGRSNIAIRIAPVGKPEQFTQVLIDADRPRNYRRKNQYGYVAVHVDTNWRRESMVTVYFRTFTGRPADLQLFARQRAVGGEARYRGNDAVGFALADPRSTPEPRTEHVAKIDWTTHEVHLQATLVQATAEIVVSSGPQRVRLAAHGGWLRPLAVNRVVDVGAVDSAIVLVGPDASGRSLAERKVLKRLGLAATVQLRLVRRAGQVLIFTSDGRQSAALEFDDSQGIQIRSTAPFFAVDGDGRVVRSRVKGHQPFHLVI